MARSERDAWRQTAVKRATTPSSPTSQPTGTKLLRRLDECNPREDANALTVTPNPSPSFARFDLPADDEDVIVYRGDLETLVAGLRQARQGWRLPHRDRHRNE
ncbi:hypothetical protein [Streptomyces sp. NPDC055642]